MSVPSCESSLNGTAEPNVGVVGLEVISHSVPLSLLFIASKIWILSLWKHDINRIKNLTISRKTIGRNLGLIIDVDCADQTANTTFYAKMQTASMDTVLIHHLLKLMKCGPERFHVALLGGSYSNFHGVITEEVKDWNMASDLTRTEKNVLLNEKKKLISATFLFTILVQLGHFGNIPNNRDNWGFVRCASDSAPYPHLFLIDFSRGGMAQSTFHYEWIFSVKWTYYLNYFFGKWEPVCGPIEDLQLFRDRTKDLKLSLLRQAVVAEQVQYFPFLQSQQAFTTLLQSACDASAQWLHEAVQRAVVDGRENLNSNLLPAECTNATSDQILTPFKQKPQPDVSGLPSFYKTLVHEHLILVEEWNDSVGRLYKWFPFANKSHHPAAVSNISATTTGDSQ